MTYPPQQPGPYGQQPGPYGQQPGGNLPPSGPQPQGGYPGGAPGYGQPGQPGPYGQPQQPGYPGATPQFPQSGAFPGGTQQFPQPDQYGQPQGMPGGFDAYGQPQQGGYPVGPPPKKSKTGLIIGIAIAAVLVIGGVVTLIVVNSGSKATTASTNGQTGAPAGGPSPTGAPSASSQASPPSSDGSSPSTSSDSSGGTAGSPEDVSALKDIAGKLVTAFGAGDVPGVKALVCDPTQVHDSFAPVVITFQSGPTFTGSQATLTFAGTDKSTGKQETFPLNAKKQSGNWCIITD